MNSMTGFGRGIGESEIGSVTAEIKAVNSRFLEINIRSDHFSGSLEEIAREAAENTFARKAEYFSVFLHRRLRRKRRASRWMKVCSLPTFLR